MAITNIKIKLIKNFHDAKATIWTKAGCHLKKIKEHSKILDKILIQDNSITHYTNEFEKNKDTFIIKNQNTLVGFSTIGRCRDKDKNETAGEVWGIYIHPDFCNKGYGTKLFQFVVRELINRNYQEITLWVLEENISARRFYERNE